MRKAKSIALGTSAGLAIGAMAGILFAPHKGSETRQIIIDKRDDYLNKRKLERAKKEAEKLVHKGKTKYDDFRSEIKAAASDYKQSTV